MKKKEAIKAAKEIIEILDIDGNGRYAEIIEALSNKKSKQKPALLRKQSVPGVPGVPWSACFEDGENRYRHGSISVTLRGIGWLAWKEHRGIGFREGMFYWERTPMSANFETWHECLKAIQQAERNTA